MTRRYEPIFNVPPVVIATVAVLVLVHVVRLWALSDEQDAEFLLTFAFIPARYDSGVLAGAALPGGFGAELWTFFTYAFLHADLLHLGLNLAWLLPFGRRWRVVSAPGATPCSCWSWRPPARSPISSAIRAPWCR